MDENQFWTTLEHTWQAPGLRGEDQVLTERADRLRTHLAGLEAVEVRDFHRHLAAAHRALHTWHLREAASVFAECATAAEFAAFRTWVITLGREAATATAADPDALADHAPDQPDLPLLAATGAATRFDTVATDVLAQLAGDAAGLAEIPAGDPVPDAADLADTRSLAELFPALTRATAQEPPLPWREGAATVAGAGDQWGPGPFDNDAGLSGIAVTAWGFVRCDDRGIVTSGDLGPRDHEVLAEEFAEVFDNYLHQHDEVWSDLDCANGYATAGLVAAALTGHGAPTAAMCTRRDRDDDTDPLGLGHHWGYGALLTPATARVLRDQALATTRLLRQQHAWLATRRDPTRTAQLLAELERALQDA